VANLEEVFGELCKYDICLNPEKIHFRGQRRQVPRLYDHTSRNKSQPQQMHNPTNIQKFQKLNGRLASLSKFLPKLAKKAKPLYKLLKKT